MDLLNFELHCNIIRTHLDALNATKLFWFRKIWLVKRNIFYTNDLLDENK